MSCHSTTDLLFRNPQADGHASAIVILPLQIEVSACVGRKTQGFDETQDLYSENVQIGDQFKVEGQAESVEILVESWITERGKSFLKVLFGKLNKYKHV